MKKLIILLLITSAFINCESEKKKSVPKTVGDFTFSSNEIIAGEPFTISYNGDGTFANSFYHSVKHTKVYPKDVIFTNNEAVISIPDSISTVVFHFMFEDKMDNNKGKGYVFSVVDENGKLAIDAEAAKQYYLTNDGSFYDLTSGDAVLALNAVESVLTEHPELTEEWIKTHVAVAQQVGGDKAKVVANTYISKLSEKAKMSLEDYESLYEIYSRTRDTKKADSLANLVGKMYPDSKMAIQKLTSKFFELQSIEEKEAYFIEHKDQITGSENAKYFYQSLARDNFNKGNMEAFQDYLNLVDSKTARASVINGLAWPKALKGEDLEEVSKLSKQSLDLVAEEMKTMEEQPSYYSTNQYKQSLEGSYQMYADTYAMLLFKKGDIREAIEYQEKAIGKGYSPDNNEHLIEYLIADKQYEKAAEMSKSFISEGRATGKIKDYFKDAFSKAGLEGDVATVLEEMENTAKAKQLEILKKVMMDEKAPDFTAKNLAGEEVTLSSLKGKTVILDFWATWCGPCISSFPGMQRAVTKYKDDENVVFLFVDTFESGENRIKEVQDFIDNNKYTFHVLIDPKVENGSNYEIAEKYKISGIPTKVVIGPSGRMNFKDVGFSGSNDKLVDKIDSMVQLLKAAP